MTTTPDITCPQPSTPHGRRIASSWLMLMLAIPAWVAIYALLPRLSRLITYGLLRIGEGTHLGSSVEFFFYDVHLIYTAP